MVQTALEHATYPAPHHYDVDRSFRYLGATSVASFLAAVLTVIYLCNVCSCHEILRCNGRG
eukprot:COSAG01_NODE_9770_length_2349_cov_1.145333_3_plen_61_part_00